MKQRLVVVIVSQFVRPCGFWGLLAGWEMALRFSNRRRNAWVVRAGLVDLRLGSAEQLLDFGEPFDRILAVNNMGMWPDLDRVLKDLRRITSSGGRIAIVSQPRGPGANAETTQRLGREAAERFRRAGFVDIRSETLALSPPVVCVLG